MSFSFALTGSTSPSNVVEYWSPSSPSNSPSPLSGRVLLWDCTNSTVVVCQVYEQTPKAGSPPTSPLFLYSLLSPRSCSELRI